MAIANGPQESFTSFSSTAQRRPEPGTDTVQRARRRISPVKLIAPSVYTRSPAGGASSK